MRNIVFNVNIFVLIVLDRPKWRVNLVTEVDGEHMVVLSHVISNEEQ